MSENVKFEIAVPKKLWKAFTWYVKKTPDYISHDHTDTCYNAVIVRAMEEYLESELSAGCPDAREAVYEELKQMLE